MKVRRTSRRPTRLSVENLESRHLLAAQVVISEFLAANNDGLEDEDGDKSDWVELFNAGDQSANLLDWSLTDKQNDLDQWKFPAVTLDPGQYLVVFASNKNRDDASGQLHTNFRLSDEGEYLALVKPDGTIATEFTPQYPLQVGDVSFGVPTGEQITTLLGPSAPARIKIPTNASLDPVDPEVIAGTWLDPQFNDSSWTSGTLPAGYVAAPTALLIADSIAEYSGVQGQNSWNYGYWNYGADIDKVYATGEFSPMSSATFRTSTQKWDLTLAPSPVTELDINGGRPAGTSSGTFQHHPMRRYTSEISGQVRIDGTLADLNPAGDGVVGRIYVNGAVVYSQAINNNSINFSVTVPVAAGQFIDFAIDSGPASNDTGDETRFSAQIFSLSGAPQTPVVYANSVTEWSSTGVQGAGGWRYGYYDRTNDSDHIYQAANFTQFPQNYWNGSIWDWPAGDPPWTMIGQTDIHPNGTNNITNHWAIRRWVSDIEGSVTVNWTVRKTNPNGDGVTGRLFVNGVQVDSLAIGGTDTVGATRPVQLANMHIGDTIDLALDSTGLGGDQNNPNDGSDGSATSMTIEGVPSFAGDIVTNLESAMKNVNAGAYLRIPFNVTDPTLFESLRLKLKYDDGFVAYLNGQRVAFSNAPEALNFDSTATAARPIADSIVYQTFDISGARNLLVAGANVLQIHGLNVAAGDNDFLMQAILEAGDLTIQTNNRKYFTTPTPGEENGFGTDAVGPIVRNVEHLPATPSAGQPIVVTAAITPTFAAIGSVKLFYRVMYGAEVMIPMVDNGTSGDEFALDGIYTATIPGNVATAGQMVRWYILADDGGTASTRVPAYENTSDSEQYLGTVVNNPALLTNLPTFQWFVPDPTNAANGAVTFGSLYYNGEFYDNVRTDQHGQSTGGFAKKSFDVDFPMDHRFLLEEGTRRMKDINWLTNWADRTKMRNTLAWETYTDAGVAGLLSFPVRIQQNGQFFSIADFVEDGDDRYLERVGLDPNGALYKMYSTFNTATSGYEKKSRQQEGAQDLQDFWNGTHLTGTALTNYLFDNVNLAATMNYLAGMVLVENTDCCHKNYYFYRDAPASEGGTGEWMALPWDQDLTFGHNWTGNYGYFDETLYSQDGLYIGNNNEFMSKLFANPTINQMYLRRVRTLMDQLLQPPGTPAEQAHFETRIKELSDLLGLANYAVPPALPPNPAAPHDAYDDRAKWGVWGTDRDPSPTVDSREWNVQVGALTTKTVGTACPTVPTPQATPNNWYGYFYCRREYLFNSAAALGIPASQPASTNLTIGAIDYRPASGNQDEEYIEVRNNNAYAVDVTNWTVSGDITHTFAAGTVIPANTTLYLTANSAAFRARATGPHGNQGLFVQGGYEGHLSARGGTIEIRDPSGRLAASNTFAGAPSAAQQYLRISEVMYNPAETASDSYLSDDYEFIELHNTGPAAINLAGVHFSEGVSFNFTGSPVTSIAPGQYVLIVHNLAAFSERYNTAGMTIAGTFTGSLDNSGERLRLDDAQNEMILDFDYEDDWYPVTDGSGFALHIVNDTLDFHTWDSKTSWRPTQQQFGSPGSGNTYTLPAPGSIVINEVLSNTTGAIGDWIELRNTTATPINIGGWYLSDDDASLDLAKYQIPAGTTIPAGGYITFNARDHFGPTANGANGFGLSSLGDEVVLTAGTIGGGLLGYQDRRTFGASELEQSIGRYFDSTTAEHFTSLASPTNAATNSGPAIGAVVINEVMYNPAGASSAGNVEFIELRNRSAVSVPLFDPANPANVWQFSSGVSFAFPPANGSNAQYPSGVTLAPGEFLLVVAGNPEAFRQARGLPASLKILGPFTGSLDNAGETLTLAKPSTPDGLGAIGLIEVDRVEYSATSPWPVEADGQGSALGRIASAGFGSDPTSWGPTNPGGTPGATNAFLDVTPPTTPTNLVANITGPAAIQLNWTASTDPESGIGMYRIYRDDSFYNTSATNSFVDNAAQPGASYSYRVSAVNAGGTEGTRSAATAPIIIFAMQSAAAPVENRIRIVLSEPVTSASAQAIGNYAVTGGVAVVGAALQSDNQTVLLTTTSLTSGQSYMLTASNLVATSGRTLAPNSVIQVALSNTREDFSVRQVRKAGGVVGSLIDADALLALPNGHASIAGQATAFYPTLNFRDDDGIATAGFFPGDVNYPANTVGNNDDFAVQATANVIIPPDGAGNWTFAIGMKPQPIVAIPTGATWRYLDNGTDQGTAWQAAAYNDTPGQNGWKSGPAQLGYGENDEATVVDFGGNTAAKFVTTYLRKTFTVADKNAIVAMAARVLRDDGFAMYLNGVEILRNNLVAAASSTTLATAAVSGADETTFFNFENLNLAPLVNGVNTLAVELHQSTVDSSDLSFDMELLLSTVASAPPPPTTTLVAAGSTWRYLDNGTNQGTAWQAPNFTDTPGQNGWKEGPAQLGYGDGDEITVVDCGPAAGNECTSSVNGQTNKYWTTYFRKTFTVADPSLFSKLTVKLLRDDGATVYLNGTPIVLSNLTASPAFNAPATGTVSGTEETTSFITFENIDATLLVPGSNTLAVEVHQVAQTSTDMSFDLSLEGVGSAADDGARLKIDGQVVLLADRGVTPDNRFATVSLTPGPHAIDLVYFERNGGSQLELYAAQGTRSYFGSDFRLVGDTAGGGLAVSSTGAPPNQSPFVVDVLAASSQWTPAFITALGAAGLGGGGYSLNKQAGQLSTLPWSNLDQIKVRFSEPVVVNQSQLGLFGVNVADYVATVGLKPGGFSYDAASRTATWTFNQPLGPDALRVVVDDAIVDAGGATLDGEWIDGTSAYSGNGTTGGDLRLRFNVLPGDVNASGQTTTVDTQSVRTLQFTSIGHPNYNAKYDIDGNGFINLTDLVLTRDRQAASVPAGTPGGSPEAPAAIIARSRAAVVPATSAVDRALEQLDDRVAPASGSLTATRLTARSRARQINHAGESISPLVSEADVLIAVRRRR